MTHIVKVKPGATTHPQLAALGALLADGELVAFPTETVYGIAARADRPDAIERLRGVKGRPTDRPFTVHLADVEDIVPLIEPPGPIVSRIMRRLWPGPLTLVLADRQGGTTGFRLPDCEIARALFRAAGLALVATSANPSGAPDLISGRQVVKAFKGRIAGIISAGRTTLATPSTVASVTGRQITVLRPGAMPAEAIREAGRYDVLFVCSGNLCRSPMAEAMLRRALAVRLNVPEEGLPGIGIRVHSAGTLGMRGYPAPLEAIEAVQAYGADLEWHQAAPLTREMVRRADVIYVAERAHAHQICSEIPEAEGKVLPMSADGRDVPDPYGGSAQDYRVVAGRIENALESWIERTTSMSGL